jgi:hypothetical protein
VLWLSAFLFVVIAAGLGFLFYQGETFFPRATR